jgi:pimeloyl-ACP methyl ester carboxylesterase
MSTPRTLRLPEHVVPVSLATARGTFAALATEPEDVPRAHVVLVPGWTGSKEDFAPLLPLLRAAGYSATAYDQRGQMETTGLPEDDYTLAGYAEDAVAVAESAGAGAVHLLGHSFGGLVAQTAAAAHPEAWRSLSLLCTGPGALGESPDRPLSHLVEVLDRDSLEEVYGQLQEARGRVDQPADVEEFTRRKFLSNAVASRPARVGRPRRRRRRVGLRRPGRDGAPLRHAGARPARQRALPRGGEPRRAGRGLAALPRRPLSVPSPEPGSPEMCEGTNPFRRGSGPFLHTSRQRSPEVRERGPERRVQPCP